MKKPSRECPKQCCKAKDRQTWRCPIWVSPPGRIPWHLGVQTSEAAQNPIVPRTPTPESSSPRCQQLLRLRNPNLAREMCVCVFVCLCICQCIYPLSIPSYMLPIYHLFISVYLPPYLIYLSTYVSSVHLLQVVMILFPPGDT